jgi:Hepatocellular carcinoma-associated antigen 59
MLTGICTFSCFCEEIAFRAIETNNIRMEYIESELAKRQNRSQTDDERSTAGRPDNLDGNNSFTNAFSKREPATLGKLHEIDLGQEAKLQNIARTEEATRRMVGDASDSKDDEPQSPGKNSKAWRTRQRNREDIERDRLVEEVLRESKRKWQACSSLEYLTNRLFFSVDVYDEPEQAATLDDQAADDRIAEQFRRDFMEAIQSRRRTMRARATTNQVNKKATKPEPPRGPKLGGSRSARAAMREMQEKSGKK